MSSLSVKTFPNFSINVSVSLRPLKYLVLESDLNDQSKIFAIWRYFVATSEPKSAYGKFHWKCWKLARRMGNLHSQLIYQWILNLENLRLEVAERKKVFTEQIEVEEVLKKLTFTRFIDEIWTVNTSGVALRNFRFFQWTFQFAQDTQRTDFHTRFVSRSWTANTSDARMWNWKNFHKTFQRHSGRRVSVCFAKNAIFGFCVCVPGRFLAPVRHLPSRHFFMLPFYCAANVLTNTVWCERNWRK